jgi:hypothetical protein
MGLQMSKIPTVKILHPDGFCWINEADFIPAKHQLFDAPAAPVKAAPRKYRKSRG